MILDMKKIIASKSWFSNNAAAKESCWKVSCMRKNLHLIKFDVGYDFCALIPRPKKESIVIICNLSPKKKFTEKTLEQRKHMHIYVKQVKTASSNIKVIIFSDLNHKRITSRDFLSFFLAGIFKAIMMIDQLLILSNASVQLKVHLVDFSSDSYFSSANHRLISVR